MFINKYGSDWAQIPATSGRIFWVAPADGYTVDGRTFRAADGNDGLSPERACRTINHVLDNLVTADVNDVIVCLPGSHLPQDSAGTAASLAMDTAGVTLMGLTGGAGNYLRQKTTIAAVASNQNCNVTAADCEIAYLNWIPVTTDSAIDLTAAADRLHIHHCSFDMFTPAADSATIPIDAIGGASNVLINDCYFQCDGDQGPGIAAGAILDSVIEDCTFTVSAGTWVNAITQAAAGRRLIIRRCMFQAGNAAITDVIRGTVTGEVSMVLISDCRFPDSAVDAVDDYESEDCELVENFVAGLGATDGGVIVTSTT